MTNIIKNFELVENKQGLVITYPIEESNALKNIDEVNAKLVKNDKNYYDILILSLDGLEKTIFENLDRDLVEKLENKTLKIPFKNNYSIFIEFISHPLFHLVGWLATILGTTYAFSS